MNKYTIGFLLFVLLITIGACNKGEKPFTNPYDDPTLLPPEEEDIAEGLDSTSFIGLHYEIFSPHCANSGCHDGSFEPDFRSVESSYNTLVNHPLIKNDPYGSYALRVVPGDAESSMLYQRLLRDIDGVSGWMPLSAYYNPEHAYHDNRAQYTQNVKDWIDAGALDMFGNEPVIGNSKPLIEGVIAYSTLSTTLLSREPGNGFIEMPDWVTSLDIWFSFHDAETASADLTYNKIKFYSLGDGFEDVIDEFDLSVVTPITEDGYFGEPVSYTHKITIPKSSLPAGQNIFMRVYIQDNGEEVVELPTDGSANYIKKYVAFKRL